MAALLGAQGCWVRITTDWLVSGTTTDWLVSGTTTDWLVSGTTTDWLVSGTTTAWLVSVYMDKEVVMVTYPEKAML